MKSIVVLLAIFSLTSVNASIRKPGFDSQVTKSLLSDYMKNYPSKKELANLKKKTLDKSGKSVPALIQVMKSSAYPEKNRWIATFLLGQIMGDKSAPFISKFIKHPNWVMRMASLKTLMALKQKDYKSLYKNALKDKSLIVRTQALELVNKLHIDDLAPNVWAMLYDKKNYYQSKNSKSKKRIPIIKSVIKTVGDLKFKKARDPLFTMASKKKYDDIFSEIDYALEKIVGKKSPKGSIAVKRRFWNRLGMSYKTL